MSNGLYKAFIPSHNTSRMGLIRGISPEISDSDLISVLEEANPHVNKILKVRRLNYKDNSGEKVEWKPSRSVVVTFEGQELPLYLYLYYNSFTVETYFFPTVQCFQCCKFGHTKKVCRSPEKCFNCGGNHSSQNCPSQTLKCFNCNGPHKAISLSCPEYSRQKAIKFTMASENLSYIQASKQHPSSGISYAAVASKPIPTPTVSQKIRGKFTYKTPRAPLAPGYNQAEHNDLLLFPNGSSSSQAINGCALNPNSSPANNTVPVENLQQTFSSDNESFIKSILSILLNLLTSQKSLPSNVACFIPVLQAFIENGSSN